MSNQNDFAHRPNSSVQYRNPREMEAYLAALIYKGVQMIEFRQNLIVNPADRFPYTIDANKSVAFLSKLITLLTNTTTQVLMAGFVEKLDRISEDVPSNDFSQETIDKIKKEYEKFLVDVSQNIAILQQELGV